MIDRYTIHSTAEEIAKRFKVEPAENLEPQYNAAPTKTLPVIVDVAKEGLSFFYWGIIEKWSNKRSISTKLINAPLDQLLSKPNLKNALQSRRCIIPANGFYLWKTVGKKSKRPYYFKLNREPLFGIAGLWEDYDDLDGKVMHTFKVITTENKLGIPEFGDFMPAILSLENEKNWLQSGISADELSTMVKPLDSISDITFHPVSPFINHIDYNFPEMINVQPSIDQKGNYTLFE